MRSKLSLLPLAFIFSAIILTHCTLKFCFSTTFLFQTGFKISREFAIFEHPCVLCNFISVFFLRVQRIVVQVIHRQITVSQIQTLLMKHLLPHGKHNIQAMNVCQFKPNAHQQKIYCNLIIS